MTEVIGGNSVKLRCEFKTWEGSFSDPTSLVLNIYAPSKQRIINTYSIGVENRISIGVYEFVYLVPSSIDRLPPNFEMIYEFVGVLEGTQVLGQGKFRKIEK